jgi:c-di-GMP-binding flagellar brake protein YcgR
MSERREYFRVRALARVRLRSVDKAQAEALRHALYAQPSRGSADERAREGEFPEQRALLDGLRQISLALERIERRLERLELGAEGAASPSEPVEISLSGAGFAGPFELELEPDQLVWAELELPGSGLAKVCALARPVRGADAESMAAFHFEDIHPDDREQLVQLALRLQSQQLRASRGGAPR